MNFQDDVDPETAVAIARNRQALAAKRAEEVLAAATAARDRIIRRVRLSQRIAAQRVAEMPFKRVVPLLLLLAFINIILVVVAIIRPVPNFALSASLFYIQARDASAYSKRSFPAAKVFEQPTTVWHDRRCGGVSQEAGCVPSHVPNSPIWPTTQYVTLTLPTTTTASVSQVTATRPIPSAPVGNVIDAGTFTALWIGVLGICLQRASGSLICTGASVNPSFQSTYQQSRLGPAITSRLPATTGGPAAGLILGIVFYGLFFVYLLLGTVTPDYIYTPYGKLGSPAAKYQWTLGMSALISSCALFAVAISTILLRNSFSRAISSIEAIDNRLTTKLGSSFSHLYAVCAIGGVMLLSSIVLIHVTGERQQRRKRISANQDYSFDLLDDLHAISVAGSQVSTSRF